MEFQLEQDLIFKMKNGEESVILEEKKAQLDNLIKETDSVLGRLKQEVSEMQKRR